MATSYPDAKSTDSLTEGVLFQSFVAEQMRRRFGVAIDYYTNVADQYASVKAAKGMR